MAEFDKYARVSARLHPSEKTKLKKSGYTARHAIEYFNKIANNEVDLLSIDEFFLNKEIENLKIDLIAKEMQLEEIQKRKDELYTSKLSELRIKSYQNIIAMYGDIGEDGNLKQSFEDFVQGKYIQDNISSELSGLNCDLDDYMEGLLNYYNDVILVGRTA